MFPFILADDEKPAQSPHQCHLQGVGFNHAARGIRPLFSHHRRSRTFPEAPVAAFEEHPSNRSAVTQDDPVKAERSDYLDAGISQKLAAGFQVGRGRILQSAPRTSSTTVCLARR